MANPVHYFRLYFNCAYYLCIFPFRFEFCPEIGKYFIVRNIRQQVFWTVRCVLALLNGLLYAVWEYDFLRKRAKRREGRLPDIYFKRVNLLTDGVIFIIIFITQLTGAEKFLKLFNTLHQATNYDTLRSSKFQVMRISALFFLQVSIAISMILAYFSDSAWSLSGGISYLAKDGISQFFLTGIITKTSFSTITFTVIRIYTLISYAFYMYAGQILLLTASFAISDCLTSFSEFVKNKDTSGMEAYNEFNSLKTVIYLINDALGLLLFGVVFGLLPYFIVTFASFTDPDITDRWDFVIQGLEICTVYLFLGFAANIACKGNLVLDRYIHTKDMSQLSHFQMSSVLYDVDSHFVQFSCAGVCNISPKFVGGISQLLLTFSVFIIQFQRPT